MNLEDQLLARCEGKCELCHSVDGLQMYAVPPQDGRNIDNCIMVCNTCLPQIERKVEINSAHWQCLSESMWSEVPSVQVVSWRMLNRLRNESWAADNLDMLYLDEELLRWAKATGEHESDSATNFHRDANGNQLMQGDTVVLTKSLDVKGSSLNAKIGTAVRNIRLVENNIEQIEGKVEGQTIVILTKYVRKQTN